MYFGLQLVDQSFPRCGVSTGTQKCNVFHFRSLPTKCNEKILWKLKSGKSTFLTFLFLDCVCCEGFHKKLMNKIPRKTRFQEKLVTDVRMKNYKISWKPQKTQFWALCAHLRANKNCSGKYTHRVQRGISQPYWLCPPWKAGFQPPILTDDQPI